jgi:hypothetical protein
LGKEEEKGRAKSNEKLERGFSASLKSDTRELGWRGGEIQKIPLYWVRSKVTSANSFPKSPTKP